jgi:hypothetical protein
MVAAAAARSRFFMTFSIFSQAAVGTATTLNVAIDGSKFKAVNIRAIVADWVGSLRQEELWGLDDPLFPATKVEVGESLRFEAAGLDHKHWSSAGPIRTIQGGICVGGAAVLQPAQLPEDAATGAGATADVQSIAVMLDLMNPFCSRGRTVRFHRLGRQHEPGREFTRTAVRQAKWVVQNGGYALRRKSEVRTRARNCSGVAVGTGSGFGFTTAGAAGFVAFFVVLRAASRASCLVAKSFASASIVSAGEPSRATRWS